MTPSDISVVIPTLNEQPKITACLQSAIAAGATELIVADGGSSDDTKRLAREAGATVFVDSPSGRGTQLNAGSAQATREYLLFLHADNILGDQCLQQICEQHDATWGAFRQRIDSERWIYRTLEFGNALRVQWRRMPFGDQAVFVRRDVFESQGGFADVPLMEDVVFAQTMRRISKPKLLSGPVTISSRRWQATGVVRQTIRNWKIQLAFACGASPETMARWYRKP